MKPKANGQMITAGKASAPRQRRLNRKRTETETESPSKDGLAKPNGGANYGFVNALTRVYGKVSDLYDRNSTLVVNSEVCGDRVAEIEISHYRNDRPPRTAILLLDVEALNTLASLFVAMADYASEYSEGENQGWLIRGENARTKR